MSRNSLFGITRLIDPFLAVTFTLLLLPIFLIGYPVCQYSRKYWIRFVRWKYPHCIVVEESSTRTILDQGRNQGVYTLLMECPSITLEHLRNHLVQLSSTKPLLRLALTSKYCLYVWEKMDKFALENHLVTAPNSFRGRPISETNVQDYVSDVASKYLPANYSPWQVHVITHQQRQTRHILIRVHHLILHEEHLAIGDFVPLERARWSSCLSSRESTAFDSPFTNLYSKPSALPKLHQKLTESFSNVWNEFLCNNDPTEMPDILKRRISLWQCVKISVIICFSTIKEISRQYRKKEGFALIDAWPAYIKESQKRNFNWSVIFQALLNLLNPVEILRTTIAWIWYLIITVILKLPILLIREFRAASLLQEHHYYPDSLVSILSCYLPLIVKASFELFSILSIAASVPFVIIEELFRRRGSAGFRTVSQSGRKVLAWSDEIEIGLIQRMSSVSGASNAEILLVAAVDSLKEYYRCLGQSIPEEVLATAKFTNQRSLYVNDCESNGLICLALPTKTPLFEDDLIEMLQVVQRNVLEARQKQRAIYAITLAETSSGLLTSCLPSVFLKVILNHLTRRYSISVTHVDGDIPVNGVQTAVFWKPPQGNCSLSLTLHRHEKVARLGVMADAMIGPQHAAIARTFPGSIHKLAKTLGVQRRNSSSSLVDGICRSTS